MEQFWSLRKPSTRSQDGLDKAFHSVIFFTSHPVTVFTPAFLRMAHPFAAVAILIAWMPWIHAAFIATAVFTHLRGKHHGFTFHCSGLSSRAPCACYNAPRAQAHKRLRLPLSHTACPAPGRRRQSHEQQHRQTITGRLRKATRCNHRSTLPWYSVVLRERAARMSSDFLRHHHRSSPCSDGLANRRHRKVCTQNYSKAS